jgi:hypothetical protein
MSVTTNEVYDRVPVQTLEEGDRIEVAGYPMLVRGVVDDGLWIYLDLYNEDTDEDEEGTGFAANVLVDLIRETYED